MDAPRHRCRHCGGPLSDPFYRLNDRPVCEGCMEADQYTPDIGSPLQIALSIGAGVAVSLILAAVYAWGTRNIGGIFYLFVLVMGLGVGYAMLQVSGSRSNIVLQWSGAAIAGLSVVCGNILYAILYPNAFFGLPTLQSTSALGQAIEKTVAVWGLFDWVFLAIAAFEAWQILRPTGLARVEGPYPLSSLETVEPSR